MIHLLILLFSLFHCGRALQTSPLATIPLFVRSPYLNCWGTFYYRDTLKIQTVAFSDTQQPRSGWDPSLDVLDLVVLVRVDKSTYLFIGDAPTVNATINFTNVVISPTQTKLTAEAGPMQFNLTFLNPIEPRDWINQSIPFSYMSLTARSLDGAAHATQIYSDLRIVWLQNPTQVFSGDTDSNPDIFYYSIYHGSEWSRSQSTLYFAAKLDGLDVVTINLATNGSVSRDLFRRNGVLDVFAISRDLGTIQATQDPVIWAIGYDIDPVINYTDLSGAPPQQRRLFYKVQYDDGASILSDFISDFANASSRAQELDQKILQYGAPISGPLEYLVSFATAQVYGSFHLTTSIDANGYFNKSDVMALMRSSSGSRTYRVNAVETLYSAFPAFMCIDPELGGLFLESLFRPQASPKYTNPYAAADLGGDYPDVTFTNSAHNQGVEQSGNMLIMTYAHARASGDVSLIGRYYDLLTSWADYLSNATLLIHDQSSADGLSADNQTNLAIKGIIAVEAMSKMSSIVKQDADVDKYSNTAAGLYAQWKSLALTSDKHLFATYEQVGSWTLGYNLFADVWLNTSIVESSVYDGQSNFINSLLLALNYSVLGVPVDNLGSDTSVSVPGWGLFVAAMTPDQDIRTKLILSIEAAVINGVVLGFDPALGAMYAPLALKAPVVLTASALPHTGVSVVIRGVIGGVAALLGIGAMALVVWRRRRQSHKRASVGPSFQSEIISVGTQATVTPFNLTGLALTEVAPLDAGPETDLRQLLVHPPPALEGPPAVTVPVGLSSKELARLRSLANASHSQPTGGWPSDPPLVATTEVAANAATSSPEAQSLAQRLQSENNILRHEIEQLRGGTSELPPSYASDAA